MNIFSENDVKVLKNPIEIKYKNWKNEISNRIIIPVSIWYGESDYHKSNQWFIKAIDVNKNALRDFAIKDILEYIDHKEDWYNYNKNDNSENT